MENAYMETIPVHDIPQIPPVKAYPTANHQLMIKVCVR